MERLNERYNARHIEQVDGIDEEQVALVYIQSNPQSNPQSGSQSGMTLRRVAWRIRNNVRRDDTVLLDETSCTIVLPGTPPAGAQAVARRISLLLVDIEYELQILYGPTALALLQRLQAQQATQIVDKDTEPVQIPRPAMRQSRDMEELPYLAFLESYPSPRLLHLLPYELACRYRCVPVGAERRVLTIATCRRLDYEVVSQFQAVTQRDIFQVRCEAGIIDDVLQYWKRTARV